MGIHFYTFLSLCIGSKWTIINVIELIGWDGFWFKFPLNHDYHVINLRIQAHSEMVWWMQLQWTQWIKHNATDGPNIKSHKKRWSNKNYPWKENEVIKMSHKVINIQDIIIFVLLFFFFNFVLFYSPSRVSHFNRRWKWTQEEAKLKANWIGYIRFYFPQKNGSYHSGHISISLGNAMGREIQSSTYFMNSFATLRRCIRSLLKTKK